MRNRIAYANEANIVKKDSLIQLIFWGRYKSEGLNGVVAFTFNGQYFGFFTANGDFFSIMVNSSC